MRYGDYFSYKKQAYMLALSNKLLILIDNKTKILVDKYMTTLYESESWKDIVNFILGYTYKKSKCNQ